VSLSIMNGEAASSGLCLPWAEQFCGHVCMYERSLTSTQKKRSQYRQQKFTTYMINNNTKLILRESLCIQI
jgi:hypothetical protein